MGGIENRILFAVIRTDPRVDLNPKLPYIGRVRWISRRWPITTTFLDDEPDDGLPLTPKLGFWNWMRNRCTTA